MTANEREAVTYRFGRFALSDEIYELRCDGAAISVEKKAVDIILTLIKQRERVVSRRELLASVWPEVSVSPRVVDTAVYEARKALGDDPKNPAMIKTVHGRGYRWIAPIIESADGGGSFGAQSAAEISFVGRHVEAAEFENAITGAMSGSGSCLVFVGEPGVGKSKLLDEFVSTARRFDALVARSQCSPVPDLPALWPVRQMLAALAASGDPQLGTQDSRCPELGMLMDSRSAEDFSTARASEDLKAAQLQMFGALASYIGRSAAPVVMLVDDVQWADRTSLQVLSLLAERARRLPLVLVVAARSNIASGSHEGFDHLLSAATRAATLEPLNPSEVRAYLSRAWHREPTVEEVRRFESLTGGNPLFLSLTFSCSSLDLPNTIRAAALRHAGHLDPLVLHAVRSCAAAGDRADIALVAEALEVRPAELLGILAPAFDCGLLRSERIWSVRFRHSLVREALYDELSLSRRASLHAGLGLALLDRIRRGRSDLWDEAGFHLATCGDSSLGPKAFFCLGVAASSAYQRLAFEDAVLRSESAMSLASGVPDEMVCNVLIVRGSALAALGSNAATEHLRRALSIAVTLERTDMIARIAFAVAPGLLSAQAGVWDPLTADLLGEVLRALPKGESEWKPLVQARLAQSLYWGPGTREHRENLVSAALAGVKSGHSEMHVSIVRVFAAAALYGPETLDDRLSLPRSELRDGASALEVDTAFLLAMIRIASLLEKGDAEAAEREVGWFRANLQRWPTTPAKWYLGLYEAMILLQRGELERALESVRRAAVLGQSVGDANADLAVGAIALSVRYLKGEFSGLDDLIGDFVQRFPRIPHWRGPQVLFRLKSGDFKGASSLASFVVAESRNWPQNATWLAGVGLLAEAVAELGVVAWTREFLELLTPYAGRLCVVGYGVSTWGTVDRILGRLQLGLRDPRAAIAHFESAIEIEGRTGIRPWKALSMGSMAIALRARAGPGDFERAEVARSEAQMLANELRMSLAGARWTADS